MILLDDNFATIVKAIKEGRRIFDNIRKFIRYILAGNTAEILTIFLAPFFGLPIPLLPIHILWINLVTDGLPSLALATEPAEKNIMRRRPALPGEGIFANGLGIHILWVGSLLAALTIGTQAYSIFIKDAHWQTMVFTVLCLGSLPIHWRPAQKLYLFFNKVYFLIKTCSLPWPFLLYYSSQLSIYPFLIKYSRSGL